FFSDMMLDLLACHGRPVPAEAGRGGPSGRPSHGCDACLQAGARAGLRETWHQSGGIRMESEAMQVAAC
ncbi:hypothetical protein, partial [Rhodovastum atsumiense]|uniref:hypothetical protein n=1 Tax=Rhodovastum atsumiense TaxID=504468 RepID=UPI00193B6E6C